MMPIIRPLTIQCTPPTEYQKEQEIFAKMEVEFRLRKRTARHLFRLLNFKQKRDDYLLYDVETVERSPLKQLNRAKKLDQICTYGC